MIERNLWSRFSAETLVWFQFSVTTLLEFSLWFTYVGLGWSIFIFHEALANKGSGTNGVKHPPSLPLTSGRCWLLVTDPFFDDINIENALAKARDYARCAESLNRSSVAGGCVSADANRIAPSLSAFQALSLRWRVPESASRSFEATRLSSIGERRCSDVLHRVQSDEKRGCVGLLQSQAGRLSSAWPVGPSELARLDLLLARCLRC